MKTCPRFLVLLVCCTLLLQPASAADTPPAASQAPTPGVELATLAAQITGIAISPLLGVSAVGAYQYFRAGSAQQRARLPWFANPMVWGIGLLIAGACAFKDAFGAAVPPGLKKPFDVLELAENKLSGLVATGAVVPILVTMATKYLGSPSAGAADLSTGGLAMIHLAAIDFSWALNLLMIPIAIAVFAVVWVASHAINVLILLSPWGGVDAVLKAARTGLLGLVTATAYIDPVVGAGLSLAVILFSYFVAGWSFRLMIFGAVFTWDFLSLRRHRFTPAANGNRVFLGRQVEKAPIRTYGRLLRQPDGRLELVYRPWLVLSERSVPLPTDGLAVGRGVFWPTVESPDEEGSPCTLLTLPPRYRGHEEAFRAAYGLGEIRDVGLRRGWTVLKELFTRRGVCEPAARPALPPA